MSMFKAAKTLVAPEKKKSDKKELSLPGLEQMAELDALISSLTTVRKTIEADLKSTSMGLFIEMGQEISRRPESFRGIDGNASASVELRKRGTNSPLNESEIALLKNANLEPKKEVITNKLYGINPAYAEDEKLLSRVESALKEIVPDDFIVLQEERCKFVVTDEVIEAAFRNDAPREVIEAVTCLAMKPKLEVTDLNEIFKKVKDIIAPEPTVEEKPKTKRAKKAAAEA